MYIRVTFRNFWKRGQKQLYPEWGVYAQVWGIYMQVCSLEGGLGPPPEIFGISGAQRTHFTPSEASLQINYQIPRAAPPLKETLHIVCV